MPSYVVTERETVTRKLLIDADFADAAITKCIAGDPYTQTIKEEIEKHAVIECRRATIDEINRAAKMPDPREPDDDEA